MKAFISKILILIILIVNITSCKDFLNVEPESVFTDNIIGGENNGDGTKYTTKQEMDLLLGGLYSGLKTTISNYYNLDLPMLTDVRSDNAYSGSIEGWALELDNFKVTPSNVVTSRSWSEHLSMVSMANVIINNVDSIPDPAMTQALKILYKAEAKILRGMMYFDLVRLYGPVPLVLKETPNITSENISTIYPLLYPSRESEDKIYEQIIADLEEGSMNGPEPYASGDKFKLTKAFANGLLAKVYATIDNKNWTKVSTYCDKAIAVGYSLLPDYESLWNNGSKNTNESIFEITYSSDSPNWGYMMFSGTDWRKFCTPSHDLEAAFMAEGEKGDLIRKNSSITIDACSWSDFWPATSYRFMNKMRNNVSSWIVMRLADILLLKAEALIELNDLAGASAIINSVRGRVNLPGLTEADKASKESMRLAVERERRLELAFEGQRWFDLIRTGRAIAVMRNCPNSKGQLTYAGIKEWMLILPVPQGDRDVNPNLDQNLGY